MEKTFKPREKKRIFILYVVISLFFVLIVVRLFALQIVKGEFYRNASDSKLSLFTKASAPRGEITDCYGRPLVVNKTSYFAVLYRRDVTEKERFASILSALSLLKEDYKDRLPISFSYPFVFSGKETEIARFKKENKLKDTATAEEIIEAFSARYKIDDTYTNGEKRLLVGVKFGMEKDGFSVSNPYTITELDIKGATRLLEHKEYFPDIEVETRPARRYLYPDTASHLLGRVGKISAEEYETQKENGYQKTDIIGKQGAEKAFESYLRGKDGIKSVGFEENGKTQYFVAPQDPVPGKSVMLTIDLELQLAAEKALEDAVQSTKKTKNGGAVVAIDVKTGALLAMASYPTYNIDTFSQNYNLLISDVRRPLFHRAIAGLYEPGSTFKPISAIAAIDSGVLTPTETIKTKGSFKYLDRQFQCNLYRNTGATHGTIDVTDALKYSCNYFFYETAKRTGIRAILETAKQFGLDKKTGIELKDEEKEGRIASPETREQSGKPWYPGDVLQAAIGQSDNLFSPLSLANYAATLANDGVNYGVHLLKAVKSGETGEILFETTPEVKGYAAVSNEALSAVKKGMKKVTTKGGTAYQAFLNFPLSVAGKTGSAQVPGGTNALFIGYAPADNPQIAVSVVVEHAGTSHPAAEVAKAVLSSYFTKPTQEKEAEAEDTLLS